MRYPFFFYRLSVCLGLFWWAVGLWASKVEVPFSTLQYVLVPSMTSDKYGFLWIGTNRGIFQYNGQTLYQYYRDYKKNTLLKSNINKIFVSSDGTLIAVAPNGVFLYDPDKDKFIEQWAQIEFSLVIDRFSNGCYLLLDNASQRILITDSTLSKTLTSVPVETSPMLLKSCKLSNGNYCIYSSTSFIIITPQLEILKRIKLSEEATCVSEVMGNILVGTNTGFLTYSDEGELMPNNVVLNHYAAGNRVNFITEISDSEIYISIKNKGIYAYEKTMASMRLISQALSPEMADRKLNLLHADANQQLWIRGNATHTTLGITVLTTQSLYPSFQELWAIHSKNDVGEIGLIAMNQKGEMYVSGNKYIYKYMDGLLQPVIPLPATKCTDLLFDRQGRLWIVFYDSIYIYAIDNEHPRLIKTFEEEGYSIDMHVVADDYVTFAYPKRLVSFDKDLNKIVHSIPSIGRWTNLCLSLNRQDVYLRSGYRYSASYNPFKGFWNEVTDISRSNINYQLRDTHGEIWLATDYAGLIHTDSNGVPIDTLNVISGLPDNSIYAVEEDKAGNIWIMTMNGIAKYAPKTKEVYNYIYVGGMFQNMRRNSILKAPDGELYLYSSTHILKIVPQSNIEAFTANKPVIHSASVNGHTFHGFPSRIDVAHDENNITLEFVSPDMMRGRLLQYEYRLEGHEHNWTAAGNNHSVVYNNLLPGNYCFQVRARYGTNPYSEVADLPIHIRPAFYQTVWFKILVTLAVLTLIFLFIRNLLRTRIAIAESRFAVENERMKVELYSNLSHLIRTPVSLINAPFQELVEERKWNSHEQELIAIIRKSINRIMDITKQFLERWSDADEQVATDTTLQVEVKDLSAIARETALMFRPTANQAGINLSLEIPESLPVPIDEDKIIKILYNLVSNALRYTPRGGDVKISVSRQNQAVTLSVSDTGTGVPDTLKKKIFERFFSPDNKAGYHFGIGLYHTRRLVQLQGGNIEVKDNKPRGAVFTITLPMEQPLAAPQASSFLPANLPEEAEPNITGQEVEAIPNDSTTPHLLLVEDNGELLRYLASALRRRYRISTAHDGIEALDLFDKESIDLVVTDVMMPRMDGYALCRWVKESAEYCHIPVVLLTAKSAKADELEGLGCGADAYLTKPFDPAKLKAVLHNLLENRKRVQDMLLKRFATNAPQPGEEPEEAKTLRTALNEKDTAFMEKLYVLLEEHLYDEGFDISRMCQELYTSKTVFYRKIRALTGTTPNALITKFRFSKVKELMETRKYNLTEIATMTGFSSISTFSRRFHAVYGMSPTEFLRQSSINQ